MLIANHFETPEEAFIFIDKDSNGKPNRSEIVSLLKDAEVSGFKGNCSL